MCYLGKRFEKMTSILDFFAGDLEIPIRKNYTFIVRFSRSIEWCNFY